MGLACGGCLIFRVYNNPFAVNMVALIIRAGGDGDLVPLIVYDGGEAGQAGGRGIIHVCGLCWVYLPLGDVGELAATNTIQLHEKPYHFWNPFVGWCGCHSRGFSLLSQGVFVFFDFL